MKNLSIRWKILAGVVIVNLIGALVVVVYLHQSSSGGLDVAAAKSLAVGSAAWDELGVESHPASGPLDPIEGGAALLEHVKHISSADYGLLIDKTKLDKAAYEKERSDAGKPSNWDERENYVLVAATDDALAEKMRFEVPAGDVPETGKFVGIENGSCAKTCHDAMTTEGDYWTVAWSEDRTSRAHNVYPITDAAGQVVGVLYSIEDISAQADSAKASMISTLMVIAITLLAATIVIGGMLDTLIFKRLNTMIVTMEDISVRIAGGDFSTHYEPEASGDEIGQFEQFFAKFMDLIAATLKALTGGR